MGGEVSAFDLERLVFTADATSPCWAMFPAQLVCQRERRSILHAKIAAEGEHAFVILLVTKRRNCHQIALE